MKFRKSFLLTILLLILFSIVGLKEANAKEHVLESLDINVFVNDDGSALIKERRIGNSIEGTENYIIIENLGKSKIRDFKVTEDDKKYENRYTWNSDWSRDEKKFKSGIINTQDGYELVWGIGNYGHHNYLLEYTVTDFIKNLKDDQVLFWRFVNDRTNIPPKKITLSVESNKQFNVQDHKVWGFGFSGDVRFDEGKIIAKSNEALNKKSYVTILAKLQPGMFKTNDNINKTFKSVKRRALRGSGYNKLSRQSIDMIVRILVILAVAIILIVKYRESVKKIKPGAFRRKYQEEYYREFPYEDDILDIYYILYKMGLGKYKNILTGFLLKWVNDDKITILKEESGIIRKKLRNNIKFLNKQLPEEELERALFKMLLKGARGRNILKEDSFRKWAKRNHKSIDKWEQHAVELSAKRLETLGYIKIEEDKKVLVTKMNYRLTESGKQIEENIYKYANYLHDYSLLNEREAINVKIWDNIMIWAGFLGITSIVEKQFKKLYPRYNEESAYVGDTIFLTRFITRNVSSARQSGGSRSSGTGGSTSSGGGGGSFGGGSGGGTR